MSVSLSRMAILTALLLTVAVLAAGAWLQGVGAGNAIFVRANIATEGS